MRHPLQGRVDGAFGAVIGFAAATILILGIASLGGKARESLAKPDLLRSWGTARVVTELGEYDQRIDCAELGLQGLTGYVWLDEGHRRVIFLCKG